MARKRTNTQHSSLGPTPLTGGIIECPPLTDEHGRTVGLYGFVGRGESDVPFTGGALYESVDGVNYELVAEVDSTCVHGYANAALPTWTGPSGSWDREHVLELTVEDGELDSWTEAECRAGKGRIWLNNEVLGYATRTRTGANTVELSNLLRGLRDTTGIPHYVGDQFVALDGRGLVFLPLNSAAIGRARSYKWLAYGQTLDEVDAEEITVLGRSVTPFRPNHLVDVRDASNNVTMTWGRRSRSVCQILSRSGVPLDEPFERYVVEVYADATFETLVREMFVDEPEALYTAAQQTADGLVPGDPVSRRVYQVGAIVRRGNFAEATL